jgi:hypothetical protein
MGMDNCVPISGGREGADREIWRGIQSILSKGTYVISKTALFI